MSASTQDDDRCVAPMQQFVHDWHKDEHNEDECCRLIRLEVAVNLGGPTEFELRIQVQVRFLVSLKRIKGHRDHHDYNVRSEVVCASLAQCLDRLCKVLLIEEVRNPSRDGKFCERSLLRCRLPLKDFEKLESASILIVTRITSRFSSE